tara:strand:- start:2216 stop:2908 length:693 start_codon:yes stop_codon:yes gene_type:complete
MRKKILVVAAHPDDELLGCGGAILYHLNRGDKIRIIIVAEGLTSRDSKRDKVTRFNDLNKLKSTTIKIFKKIGVREVDFLDFADNRLDSYNLIDVIKPIEKIIQNYKPNIIYTHNPGDLNIDHNIVNRAVMTASRPKPKISIEKIYAFEVLSSTNWSINHTNSNFEPNYFLNIEKFLKKKIKLLSYYKTEMEKWPHTRSLKSVEYLAKYRGSSVGFEAAEAFYLLREIKN